MNLPRPSGASGAPSGKQTHTVVHTAVRPAPAFLPAGEGLPLRVIRVLILEDDPDMAESLSLVLSLDEGFVVEIVQDVATCLERLQVSASLSTSLSASLSASLSTTLSASLSTALSAQADRSHIHLHPFDVLLLDLLLGAGHVGTEVLAATADAPHLELPPVVVCTGFSRAYLAAREPTLRLAANNIRVLRKPFDIDTLMTALRVAANAQKQDA